MFKNQDLKTKNIVLIGMPGCGKTTIGQELSRRLNRAFIDVDEYIINRENKSIEEIFETGEGDFRSIEAKAVKEIAENGNINMVVATGGGVVMSHENMEILKKSGIIVFIDRPVEDICEDIDSSQRPLIKGKDNVLKQLFEDRYPLYKKYADFIVFNKNLDETIEEIIQIIKSPVKKK